MLRRTRFPLGVKLGGLAALLCALTAVLVAVAIAGMNKIADDGHRAYTVSTVGLNELADARGIFMFNRALFFKYIIEDDATEKAALNTTIADGDKVVDARLSAFSGTLVTPAAKAQFALLERHIAQYRAYRVTNFRISRDGTLAAAYAYANEKVTPVGNDITAEFSKLQALKMGIARAADVSATDRFHSARTLAIVLLLVALALGAGCAFAIARGVRRTARQVLARLTSLREQDTRQLQDGLERLSAGDLTVTVEPVTAPIASFSRDELGDVARAVNAVRDDTATSMEAYNKTREALAAMIGQVAGTASMVSSASTQMASTSGEAGRAVGEIATAVGEIAEGAQRSALGIEDARRLTDEIAEATGRSADEAAATARAAQDARTIAADGADAVAQATEAMVSVRDASAQATEAIRALGGKSEEIGGIVGTITRIAEQTNLLALNAAIEAARAGEQGRGFAVVADEVRQLAEESQAAAASIAQLIGEIQAETGRAVSVVEDGAGQTASGARTVEQARDAFERIGSAVDDVTARVGQIAAAVQEIASSSAQTGSRIGEVAAAAEEASASTEQVSASTQETSASAEEIAASAGELATTARDLEALVGRFTLA